MDRDVRPALDHFTLHFRDEQSLPTDDSKRTPVTIPCRLDRSNLDFNLGRKGPHQICDEFRLDQSKPGATTGYDQAVQNYSPSSSNNSRTAAR